mgnify:CR=1 FL=1
MLILGIDTSTDILGLSLLEDNEIKAEYNLSLKRQHSEKLLPLIEEMFNLLDLEPSDLDGIAVSVGPGSFTGLRIGITTAKMIGRIFSIPVKGVSTLEIMAEGVEGKYLLHLLDARRERVYYAFYQDVLPADDNFLNEIFEPASIKIIELPKILAEYQKNKIYLIGEKNMEAAEILRENNFKIKRAELESNYPRSAVLARLGRNYIKAGKEDDIYKIKPAYLKKPQAELNWQKKYGST